MTDLQITELAAWIDAFDRRQTVYAGNSLALEARYPDLAGDMATAGCRYVMSNQPAIVWG